MAKRVWMTWPAYTSSTGSGAPSSVRKALLGVRDELKLGLSAVTVLRERYLLCDEQGRPAVSTGPKNAPSSSTVTPA